MSRPSRKPDPTQVVKTDVLVIGGGAAGIRAAVEARRQNLEVLVISAFKVGTGNNSAISQGGFSAVDPADSRDSFRLFYEDTLKAGHGLNVAFQVRTMVGGSWKEAQELEKMGVKFLKDADGNFVRVGRGGHSVARRLATPTHNGMALLSPLWKYAQGIKVSSLNGVKAIRLLKQEGQITGALLLNPNSECLAVAAKAVILASGGAGALFPKNNNTPSTVGEGYGLAFEAGLPLQDMEFVQWLLQQQREPGIPAHLPPIEFLILHGAALKNVRGQSLLDRPGKTPPLTRDALTKIVAQEINRNPAGDPFVLLDLKNLSPAVRKEYGAFQKEFMKISPVVHFFMGGVRLEKEFRTSVEGLFAAGEVVGGTHGANRLGGNALAEAFVFGSLAGSRAAQFVRKSGKEFLFQEHQALREWKQIVDSLGGNRAGNFPEMEAELQSILEQSAGVIRTRERLEAGLTRLQNLKKAFSEADWPSFENAWGILTFRNKLLVSEMILRSAVKREETRGAHVREDFPSRDDGHWLGNICIQKNGKEEMELSLAPVCSAD